MLSPIDSVRNELLVGHATGDQRIIGLAEGLTPNIHVRIGCSDSFRRQPLIQEKYLRKGRNEPQEYAGKVYRKGLAHKL